MDPEHSGDGASAHVALDVAGTWRLAAGGQRLGQGDGDRGLALVLEMGRRHHDAADGIVDGRKADVGRKASLTAFCITARSPFGLPPWPDPPPFMAGMRPITGTPRSSSSSSWSAEPRQVEHVLDNNDDNRHETGRRAGRRPYTTDASGLREPWGP